MVPPFSAFRFHRFVRLVRQICSSSFLAELPRFENSRNIEMTNLRRSKAKNNDANRRLGMLLAVVVPNFLE
jgi:hypothetical protein